MPAAARAIENIPDYLRPYIVRQDASLYTPMDHASWRFILKISRTYFARFAHRKYLDGLAETGISTERIPLIEDMDRCLRKFGWRAVAVSGFIPPGVFMEFQSLGILPIACDMRQLEHLAYTPAPDIVHEAAGHAPILADAEFARYLRSYGEIARKAIFSHQDMAIYNAIRELSDIKENPGSTPADVAAAQSRLDASLASATHDSEATLLSRMGWWTFEYGLVGSPEDPKIFGAGLLSSLGESYHFRDAAVRKVPFSIDCIHTHYDITRPQPQLYVARDFEQLRHALEELSQSMAFRRGGTEGLQKAVTARTVTTTVFDSGLQISGVLSQLRADSQGQPIYLQFAGPTQLSFQDRELPEQGPAVHREGFGTPMGRLKGLGKSPAELTEAELRRLGTRFEFESGVVVEGKLRSKTGHDGRWQLLSFADCTVTCGADILFRPEWGAYDMGCGERAVSVFGGAADRGKYLAATGGFGQPPGAPKSNLTDANRRLCELYARIRAIRESREGTQALTAIHDELEADYPGDWLARYELLELNASAGLKATWEPAVRARLSQIAASAPDRAEMITRGLETL